MATLGTRPWSCVLLLAGLVGICVGLSGCLAQPAEPLRVALNPEWPGYAPLFLAEELDLVGPPGVVLKEMPSSSAALLAFRNQTVDLAALTLDESFLLLADGIDFRVVLVTDISAGADALVARPGIERIGQLRGKRIGVETSAVGAFLFSRALDQAGLTIQDVSLVPLTIDLHEHAYLSGKVDAVVTFEPVRSALLAKGATVLFDSRQIPDEIFDVLIVRTEVLEQRPEDVARLVEGWHRAVDHLHRDPADAGTRMGRIHGLEGAAFLALFDGMVLPDRAANRRLLDPVAPAILEPARRLARIMVEHQLLPQAIDPALVLQSAPGTTRPEPVGSTSSAQGP